MSTKKEGLGKGIRALLQTIDDIPTGGGAGNVETPIENTTFFIPVDSITANPYQPRNNFDEAELKELADSIAVHGIIQPLTVRAAGHKKFQLIAGERRLRAAQVAGLTEVPVFVRVANDEQLLEMALIENTHRVDLNPIEIAINYRRLIDEIGLTQEQLGEKVGKDRTTVTTFMRLLKLPPDVQVGLKDKTISMGHARAIVSLEDPIKQMVAFKEVAAKQMSVRATEQYIRDLQERKKTQGGSGASANGTSTTGKGGGKADTGHQTPAELRPWQDKMISHFGCRVEIRPSRTGKGGEISIPYLSKGDLERILEIMQLT